MAVAIQGGTEKPHRLLTSRRTVSDLPFDSLSRWATWVLLFSVGPMFIDTVIYLLIRYLMRPENLEASLIVLLTWCLVIGLALAGFGQFLQALAHRWPSPMGRRCQTVGVLVGLGGWSTGLLAGVAFPTIDRGLSGASDPTNVVFAIVLGLPALVWVVLIGVRCFVPVWRSLKRS